MTDSTATEAPRKVKCRECGHEGYYLPDHLLEAHDMTVETYLEKYPDALTVSQALLDRYTKDKGNPRRKGPPSTDELTLDFAGVTVPVFADVPDIECLPCPAHYRLPQFGKLNRDIQHTAISLMLGRSIYIWGRPGSGKDAFIHAFSAMARRPSKIFQVRPGADIESWLYTRGFSADSTHWEEGELLRAARDGYTTPSGRTVPYILLITDFDRADRAQAEILRLITDSIAGRIQGPGGAVYPIYPGTQVIATANSAGAGDEQGRAISANPIDSSIMDRFQRGYQFHWLDWQDEVEICKAKFPLLSERAPDTLRQAGKATEALRKAIADNEVYAEWSHRAVCSWLGHAEDLLSVSPNKKVPSNLLKKAARAVIDTLPDEETRLAARRTMDPHLKGGMVGDDNANLDDGELSDF